MTRFVKIPVALVGLLASLTLAPIGTFAKTAPPQLDPTLVSCLKDKLGDTVYEQIKTGDHTVTDQEKQLAESCFSQAQPLVTPPPSNTPHVNNPIQFSNETASCLSKTLGADFENQLRTSQGDGAKQLRTKAGACFGSKIGSSATDQSPPAGPPQLPDTVKTCLVKAVGQAEADKMFRGIRPDSSSDIFQKAGSCFSSFKPTLQTGDLGSADSPPPLDSDKRSCIEKILGGSLEATKQPTDAQRQQIGSQCFKNTIPAAGVAGGAPKIPQPVSDCIQSTVGSLDLAKGPDLLTGDQKQKVGACFAKFQPGDDISSPPGQGGGKSPADLKPETKSCIEKVLGQGIDQVKPDSISDDQKAQLGKQCFAGTPPAGQGMGNGHGASQGGGNFSSDKQACIQAVIGNRTPDQATDQEKMQIGAKCFGANPGSQQPAMLNPSSNPNADGLTPVPPSGAPAPQNDCVKGILGGKSINQATTDERQQIASDCFGKTEDGSGPAPSFQPTNPQPNQPTGDHTGPPPSFAQPPTNPNLGPSVPPNPGDCVDHPDKCGQPQPNGSQPPFFGPPPGSGQPPFDH